MLTPDMEAELSVMKGRSIRASGTSWSLGLDASGTPVVVVHTSDGSRSILRIMRELDQASAADVEFAAFSRHDVKLLVDSLLVGGPIADQDLTGIRKRLAAASPGPWREFCEEDGGIGGPSVISISDSDAEPDMYIWLDSATAPAADHEFLAHARQDIATLLALRQSKPDEPPQSDSSAR